MPDASWKALERRLAKACGTTRIPVTGERHGADFETPMFCFQAKRRKGEFPKTVASWLSQIRGTAAKRSPEKVGVVIIQKPGGRDADALVVVSFKDWLELHGPVEGA